MALPEVLLALAILVLALVAVVGLRNRVLARVALRNAHRRPKQSLLVVLGLLVGTAIVSGSLVASDSIEYSIVKATYDAFQEIDETVYLPGYGFFPERVATDLANDPTLSEATQAVGKNVIWDASVTNTRTAQYEPLVRIVGYDTAEDSAWGSFHSGSQTFDDATLAPNEVVLGESAARRLGARVGDSLTLNFTQPMDPILPAFEQRTGTYEGGVGILGGPGEVNPTQETFTISRATTALHVIVSWTPGDLGQDLDAQLVSPNGQSWTDQGGQATQPDVPIFLNVTGSLSDPLAMGDWTLGIQSKVAADVDYNVTIVRMEPVYDADEFQERVQEFRDTGIDLDRFADGSIQRLTQTVQVAFIADGGKGPHFALPHDNNLFARLDSVQDWLDRTGQVNLIKVSNKGGIQDGVERTDDVMPVLRERLDATKQIHPDDPSVQALEANNDKQYWIGQAELVGQQFRLFLISVSSFSVIAGLLLIVNIFTMLAEERRHELGISRALGLKRRHLTRLFTLEGAYYAVPAAVLGTFAGLGLAWALIRGFNSFGGDESLFPEIPFRLENSSLVAAFSAGIILTIGTVYLASRRASRLNIVRSIRNLDEPEHGEGRRGVVHGTLLFGVGSMLLLGSLAGSFTGLIVGPLFIALGLGALLRRRIERKRVYPWLAAALFAFYTATLFLVTEYDTAERQIMDAVRDLLMAVCVVVIIVYSERFMRFIGRAAGRIRGLRAIALTATSYPLHRKVRTGLTLSMFAVILLVVVLFSIFGALFAPHPEEESGGYDIQATATGRYNALPAPEGDSEVLNRLSAVDALPVFLSVGGDTVTVENRTTAQFGPPLDSIYGIDDEFAARNEFRLLRRDESYATDADAYAAVAGDSSLVIVAYTYSLAPDGGSEAFGVGDQLQLRLGADERRFTIVGVQEQVHFKGIFIDSDVHESLYPNADTLFLIRIAGGDAAADVAFDLEANYRHIGLDARSIREVVLEEAAQFRQIFTLMQLFLALGLVVGILSLGIVTARSVYERRQEIGMMRAIGFRRSQIRHAFLMETVTMVLLGIFVGASVAILVSFGLWVAVLRESDVEYIIPWGQILVIGAIALVATTLATLGPIRQAARTSPAEALRYID